MVLFFHSLIQAIQPLLLPLCFISAWLLVLVVISSTWSLVRDAARCSHQMHQIPCARCRFFTNDYRLKCTVHPAIALSENAIGCPDYLSADYACPINK
ncbi:MAG: hypothetical protein ACKO24_02290 [Leptolyngbyaceae cyanobacterium]